MAVRKTWVLRFQWKILHYLVNLLTVRIGEKKKEKKKRQKAFIFKISTSDLCKYKNSGYHFKQN